MTGGGISQPNLFAARARRPVFDGDAFGTDSACGSAERRPNVAALLPRLEQALHNRGWVSGRVLCAELDTDARSLREAGNKSEGRVIGSQFGYGLTVQMPVADVVAVVNRHLSQSREQKRRALEIERVRHGLTGRGVA